MKKAFQFIFLTVITLLTVNLSAQNSKAYLYTNDSLKGFDETAFINQMVSQGKTGQVLKSALSIAKKEFIYEKYYHNHSNQMVWKTAKTTTVNPGCTNMDFETGSFSGWNVTKGINSNSTTMAGCCPGTGAFVSQVINSTGNDPLVGALLPLASPFGGSKIAKINDNLTGAVVERISQTFNVTSSNAIFQFAYAGVLQDASHSCSDQPYMNFSVIDSSGNVLACPKIDIAAPSPQCTQPASVSANWVSTTPSSGFSNVYYHGWEIKTIDLSPYIGTSITVQITVGDCALAGHFGYGYFDCKCYPLEIDLNGTTFDATPQAPINISTCGTISATITAPYGLNPYLWNGPAASGITAITTQSIATSTPATYTLVMSPLGSCYGPITKYIILHSTPNPTVTNIAAQATCTNATGSGTINVASGTPSFHYNWLPSASSNSIATGLSPGTDYTVTVVDTFGCQNTTIVSIASFTNAPTYTVSPLSGVLTCNTPTLTLSALTSTNTSAVWTNTTTSSFVVNAPGTYSCVLTNTISSCTATVPITITANTITPIATYTTLCNTNTISLNASSTAGIALGWLAPTSPVSPISNPGTSTASGIFTLTATNLSTGCKTQYTVSSGVPTITITPASNLLTCVTSSISALASSSSSSITVTWFNGLATSTVNPYPILASGSYTATIAQTGGCSTQSVITITTNTTVGVSISVPNSTISCLTNNLALTANGVGGTYTYTWVPTTPLFVGNPYIASNAGTYTVMGTNSINGCTATATQAITHEAVNASFIADTYQGLMPLPVLFTNTSINPTGTTYSWNLGNSATNYTSSVIATTYNTQGYYQVILTATKGFCQDTAIRFIKVDLISILKIPNVFTPNGDGINDVFLLDVTNMGEIFMTVFDRWGLKMLESTDTGKMAWDGKTKGGSVVSDGTYFYIIKAIGLDGVNYDLKGKINVFR